MIRYVGPQVRQVVEVVIRVVALFLPLGLNLRSVAQVRFVNEEVGVNRPDEVWVCQIGGMMSPIRKQYIRDFQ